MEKPKSGESAIKNVGNELLTLNMLTTQKKCLFFAFIFWLFKGEFMKKYLILMLCLLSLRGTAQNRYEDLGNGTVLVHRNIPSSTSSSKNTKVTSVQHLHFQGISLNTSFRNFLKYLRAKH